MSSEGNASSSSSSSSPEPGSGPTPQAQAQAQADPASESRTDPRGFLTRPPSVVVQVTGTARDDINGLLGVVLSFNVDRDRYLVHMTETQSTMAFKKENLKRASFVDKYRAQWQQLQNDPRVQEKLQHYLRTTQQYVAPWKLTHVAGGLVAFIFILMYLLGVSKTIMLLSFLSLLIVVASPDLSAKKPLKVVVANFPARTRQAIEKNAPFLRGKINDRIAMGIVFFMIGLTAVMVFSPARKAAAAARASMSKPLSLVSPESQKELLKKYYTLGFDDATAVREHGSSLTDDVMTADLATLGPVDSGSDSGSQRDLTYDDYPDASSPDDFNPPPPRSGGLLSGMLGKASSMSNIMSMIFLYRSVMSLGTEPQTGLFSMAQLAANFRGLPMWRQALLGLGVARVAYGFLS